MIYLFIKLLLIIFFEGVLVGRVNGDKVIVEDAYPLFHSRVVSPTLESAFELVNTNEKLFIKLHFFPFFFSQFFKDGF